MMAIHKALEWIMRMAYINVLWIIFTILGLVAFGLFPATAAVFSVVRCWIMGETDIPIFKTFWKTYKSVYLRGNLLGYFLLILGVILYIDIRIFNASPSSFVNLLAIPLIGITIVFILTSLYIFPTFVHYEMKITRVIKNSFLIMVINPLTTIIMLVGICTMGFIFLKIQGLIPLFSVSILAMVIMVPAVHAFNRVTSNHKVMTS